MKQLITAINRLFLCLILFPSAHIFSQSSCSTALNLDTTTINCVAQIISSPSTVWLKFKADSIYMKLDITSSSSPRIDSVEIYAGTCSSLTLSASYDAADSSNGKQIKFPAIVDQLYYIKIYYESNSSSSTSLTVCKGHYAAPAQACPPQSCSYIFQEPFTYFTGICNACCGGSCTGGGCPAISTCTTYTNAFDQNVPCWQNGWGSPQIMNNGGNDYAFLWSTWSAGGVNFCGNTNRRGEGIYRDLPSALNPAYLYIFEYKYRVNTSTGGLNQVDNLTILLTQQGANAWTGAANYKTPNIVNFTPVQSTSTLTATSWTTTRLCFYPPSTGTYDQLVMYPTTAPSNSCTIQYINLDDISLSEIRSVPIASSNTTCAGQQVTLSNTCGYPTSLVSYSWTPSTGLSCPTCSATTASPTVTTTYTLTISAVGTATTCNSIAGVVTVTVTPLPTVTITPSSSSICPGASATLTASGANSYTWNPGGSTSNPITVSPGSTTVYTVTGAVSTCTSTATQTITVNPNPTVAVNSPTMCANTQTTLTATGASTYSWSPGTGLSATTGSTVTAYPSTTTVYTVTGTSAAGCTATATSTVTVNPAPGVTLTPVPNVCASSYPASATLTLTTNASTYTWSTPPSGSSLSCSTNPCLNPIADMNSAGTYTFEIWATSALGCYTYSTVTVNVYQVPTITATSNTNICNGSSATLTVTGAGTGGTYSWAPSTGLNTTTGTVVIASPTTTTVYTVTGTTSQGCSEMTTVNVTVNPNPSFTLAASPSTICAPSYPTTSALSMTVTNAATYTWTAPGGSSLSCTANPCLSPTATINNSGSFTFSVSATSAAGCTNSSTVNVSVTSTPTLAVTASPTVICQGAGTSTLTASGATTYSWSPSSSLSSSTGATVTATPSSSTTYTVVGTTSTCTASATVTLSVTPAPAITITAASYTACNYSAPGTTTVCSGAPITFTATSGGALTSYTWTPGPVTGSVVTVTPTVTTTYTVNGTGSGCPGTNTVAVSVSTCSCAGTALPALNATTISGGSYVLNANASVTGNVTLLNTDIKIAANYSITVPSGAYLRISASHLSACYNMWQGIVVDPGGRLEIESNSWIEDAKIAVDNNPTNGAQTTNASTVIVNGAIFNCNNTSIRRGYYTSPTPTNYTTSVFSINDAVFTCRCHLPTPITTTALTVYSNTVTGTPSLTAPDLSDFYSVSNYAQANLRPPFAGLPPLDGVELQNVGVAQTSTLSPLPYINHIGGSTLVLFDNMKFGINAINATFSVTNTAYQTFRSTTTTGKNGVTTGGYAINAECNIPDWYNGMYVDNSRFIHWYRGINSINYYDVDINNNVLFSRTTKTTFGIQQLGPQPGDYGFYVSSTRFKDANIDNNRLANLATGIVFSIAATPNFYNGGTGQYIGPVTVNSNTLTAQFPGNSYTNKYIGTAIVISNVLTPVAGSTVTPGGSVGAFIYARTNTVTDAYNGIYQSNHQWHRVRTEQNSIALQYHPTATVEVNQYAIQHNNTFYAGATGPPAGYGDDIYLNTITGITGGTVQATFEKKKGIWSRFGGNHYVTCNSVTGAGRAFEFEGSHTNMFWQLNTMTSNSEGFALTNSGVIGNQPNGGATASDNQWTSPGSSYADTYTDATSVPANSRLFVRTTATYPFGPQLNLSPNGIAYGAGTLITNTVASTYSCTTLPPTRVSGSNESSTGISNGTARSGVTFSTDEGVNYLERIVVDSIVYPMYASQNSFINKNHVYRMIRNDISLLSSSSILANFYNSNASSSWALFCTIEDSLYRGNYSYANSLLTGYSPVLSIEQNYKRFYEVYSHAMQGNSTSADTIDLEALAKSCPMLNGAVVFQARALRNSIMQGFENYEDNCPHNINESRSLASNEMNGSSTLLVYPNPTNGKIYISGIAVNEKVKAIEVSDITGKIVAKQQVSVANGMIELNLNVNNGVYFIKITGEEGLAKTEKVIINK